VNPLLRKKVKVSKIHCGDLLERNDKTCGPYNLDSGVYVLFLGWNDSFTLGYILYSNGNKGCYTTKFIIREWKKCSTAYAFESDI
jgi:hypothetical protein